jgi:hypothetical protein
MSALCQNRTKCAQQSGPTANVCSNRGHQNSKTSDPLRAMDEHSFNIRSGGWAGYKHGIASSLKSGITICLMKVACDLRWIEQNNKMLGEIRHGMRPDRQGLDFANLYALYGELTLVVPSKLWV